MTSRIIAMDEPAVTLGVGETREGLELTTELHDRAQRVGARRSSETNHEDLVRIITELELMHGV